MLHSLNLSVSPLPTVCRTFCLACLNLVDPNSASCLLNQTRRHLTLRMSCQFRCHGPECLPGLCWSPTEAGSEEARESPVSCAAGTVRAESGAPARISRFGKISECRNYRAGTIHPG